MKDMTRKGLKNLCPPPRIHVLSPGQITFILLRCTWLGIDRPKPSKTDQRPLFQGIESASYRSQEPETLHALTRPQFVLPHHPFAAALPVPRIQARVPAPQPPA